MGHRRLNKFKVNFKFTRTLFVVLSLLVVSVFSASCVGFGSSQSTFEVSGPVAQNQLNLFNIILVLGVIVFVIVEAALIYVIIKFRRKNDADIPEQTHGNRTLEITWTIIPALILIIAAIPTVSGVFFAANPPLSADEGAIVVEATGNPEVASQALQVASQMGQVILLGSPRGSAEIDLYFGLHKKGVSLIGAHASRQVDATQYGDDDSYEIMLEFIADKRLKVDPLLSHKLPASQAKQGYQGLLNSQPNYLGVLLDLQTWK